MPVLVQWLPFLVSFEITLHYVNGKLTDLVLFKVS